MLSRFVEWSELNSRHGTPQFQLESFEKDSVDPNLRDDKCRILISDATRLYLGVEFSLIPVGAISLKGKSEKVTVYRVVDQREAG